MIAEAHVTHWSATGSSLHNLKELRCRSIRILFIFDDQRQAVLLVAGDKRGQWKA